MLLIVKNLRRKDMIAMSMIISIIMLIVMMGIMAIATYIACYHGCGPQWDFPS